jgi:hypothetical protein
VAEQEQQLRTAVAMAQTPEQQAAVAALADFLEKQGRLIEPPQTAVVDSQGNVQPNAPTPPQLFDAPRIKLGSVPGGVGSVQQVPRGQPAAPRTPFPDAAPGTLQDAVNAIAEAAPAAPAAPTLAAPLLRPGESFNPETGEIAPRQKTEAELVQQQLEQAIRGSAADLLPPAMAKRDRFKQEKAARKAEPVQQPELALAEPEAQPQDATRDEEQGRDASEKAESDFRPQPAELPQQPVADSEGAPETPIEAAAQAAPAAAGGREATPGGALERNEVGGADGGVAQPQALAQSAQEEQPDGRGGSAVPLAEGGAASVEPVRPAGEGTAGPADGDREPAAQPPAGAPAAAPDQDRAPEVNPAAAGQAAITNEEQRDVPNQEQGSGAQQVERPAEARQGTAQEGSQEVGGRDRRVLAPEAVTKERKRLGLPRVIRKVDAVAALRRAGLKKAEAEREFNSLERQGLKEGTRLGDDVTALIMARKQPAAPAPATEEVVENARLPSGTGSETAPVAQPVAEQTAAPGEAVAPSASTQARNPEEAVSRELRRLADEIERFGTSDGRRKLDEKWAESAIKRTIVGDSFVRGALSGAAKGGLASAKIALSKAKTLADVRRIAEKLLAKAEEAALPKRGAADRKAITERGIKPGMRVAYEGKNGRVEGEVRSIDSSGVEANVDGVWVRGLKVEPVEEQAPAPAETPAAATESVESEAAPASAEEQQEQPAQQNRVEAAAAEAAASPTNGRPEPTDAQKEAGNYKKGPLSLHGLRISIENPAGTRRRPEWPELAHHYGYIRGTEGKDGDHVDVFIGPDAENAELPVFVVDQVTQAGRFDEHKVMLGFADEAAARAGYLANYSPGWKGLGDITQMGLVDFKAWVMDPARASKRASADRQLQQADTEAAGEIPLTVENALTEVEKAKERGRDELYRELASIRGLSNSVFNGVAKRLTGSDVQDGREWSQESLTDFLMSRQAEAALNDRDTFTIERLNQETGQMEPVTFKRGEYVAYTLSGKRVFGDIDGISQARREFSVGGLWYPMGFAYKAERPAPPKPKNQAPLSAVIDKVNAKNGAGLTEADRVPEAKPKSKTPMVDRHIEVMEAVRAGNGDVEAYQRSFAALTANAEAIKAELSTKTKDELLKAGGRNFYVRYKNDKKDAIIEAFYRDLLDEYALGKTYGPTSYFMTRDGIAQHERLKTQALAELVAGQTAETLADYAEQVKSARAEFAERLEARKQAIADPKTLDEFRQAISFYMGQGKTRSEAFLELSPEQRVRYDELEAESTREAREARKRAARTSVRAAGQATSGQIIETKHTRDGYDLFVVQLSDRLSREDYQTMLGSAKKLGGWYSSFRGRGAIPGFQFKEKSGAEAFMQLAGGDTQAAQEAVDERRNAFEDDRSQTAVERLREMADRIEQRAEEALSVDRKVNTDRRARMAASAEAAAQAEKALARTMRNIADAIESGDAKFLDEVRTKSQVEMLAAEVSSAKDEELRAKHPTYAERERRRGEPATDETAGYARFPVFTAFRSDLASLGRQLADVDGTKKLGQQILSVADDVTDAYIQFAKESPLNLAKLSTFGVGDKVAEFANREAAERAIRRSKLVGKAIVLPIKRGVNRIVMSPSEAMARGIWQGDGDKRITLKADFGAQLVETIGRRANAQNRLTVPWQFESAHQKRKALARLGIETPSEFRSALREFIRLQERAVSNRVRELELSMTGRKNDGLDFFPTPQSVANQMVEAAEIEPDMAVLEPSAGMGHLADRIRASGAEPDVIEVSAERRELLEEKGYHVAEVNDFLSLEPRKFFTFGDVFRAPDGTEGVMRGQGGMGSQRVRLEDEGGRTLGVFDRSELTGVRHRGVSSGYDRIIMNPPFSKRRDAEHVRHAYELLRPGGRIVAIMGEGVFFGSDKKAEEFREWLDSVDGTSEKLEAGSFMDPSLPVNTGVNARMVVIDKPAAAAPSTDTEAPPPFSLQPDVAPSVASSQIEAAIASVIRSWNADSAPRVRVLADPEGLPARAKRDPRYRRAEGFYDQGSSTVYLVASNLPTERRALQVLAHESIGHFGMEAITGPELWSEIEASVARLEQTASGKVRAALDSARRRYAGADRATFTREAIAVMAEQGLQTSLMARVVAAVRRFLRSLGFDLRLSESDVLAMIRDSARYLRRGQPAAGQPVTGAAFARPDLDPKTRVPVVEATANRFGPAETEEQRTAARAAAAEFLKEARAAGPYTNADSGLKLGLSIAGNRELMAWTADPSKLDLLGALPQIAEQSLLAKVEAGRENDRTRFATFYAPVQVGRRVHIARMVAREAGNGVFVYDLQQSALLETANPEGSSGDIPATKAGASGERSGPRGMTVAELRAAVNADPREAWNWSLAAEALPGLTVPERTTAAGVLRTMAEQGGLFRYPPSRATGLAQVFEEVTQGEVSATFKGETLANFTEDLDDMAEVQKWEIRATDGRPMFVYIEIGGENRMYVDASPGKSGQSMGSAVYAALFQYALNDGKVLIGDPNGLSPEALMRRTEHMLSAALKHGTTRMMAPHPRQVDPSQSQWDGGPQPWAHPLRWEPGNDEANLRALIDTAHHNAAAFLRGTDGEGAVYSFPAKKFLTRDGRELTQADLARISKQAGKGWRAQLAEPLDNPNVSLIGPTTVARSIIAGTLLRAEDSQLAKPLLADMNRRVQAGAAAPAQSLFYSLKEPEAAGAAADPRGFLDRLSGLVKPESLTLREAIKSKLQDLTPAALGALTLRHIEDLGKKYLPQLTPYIDQLNRMQTDRNVLQEEGNELAEKWRTLQSKDRVGGRDTADLMHDATIEGVDPAEEYQPLTFTNLSREQVPITDAALRDHIKRVRAQFKLMPGESKKAKLDEIKDLRAKLAAEKRRRRSYPELVARWGRLSPEWQALYRESRDMYSKRSAQTLEALIARIGELDAPDDKKRATAAEVRLMFEQAKAQGPYFPLQRFGSYWIAAKNPDTGKRDFFMFESAAGQLAALRDLKVQGYQSISSGKKLDQARDVFGASEGFVTEIQRKLGAAGAPSDLQDEIWQLYLRTLPDLSQRKHFIHRKKVAGYNPDALRAFAANMNHSAYQVARLRYGHRMQNLVGEAKKWADESSKSDQGNAAAMFYNEFVKRHDWVMNPQDSALVNKVSGLGFFWYLGVTPGAALVNLTQTAIVAGPVLASRFGAAKAMNALSRGMRDSIKTGGNIERTLRDEELAAYQAMRASGAIDKTQAHNLAGIAEVDSAQYSDTWHRVMRGVSALFHKAEVVNREATGMAAYRLAREQGMGFSAAVQYAENIIWESHFDYSNANRARFMQSGAAKVLLMFRQYSLSMSYFLWRNFYQTFKGESQAVRTEARRKLTGVLGMTAVFSGALGMPLMSMVFGVANAMADALGDDDDPPFDAEAEFRNFLADLMGADVARLIARGPVNFVTGADIASRVTLDGLWLREPERELEGKALANYWLEQAAGPIGGIFVNAMQGLSLMHQGEAMRGVEAMTPKFIKDGLRSLRYATEGVNTLRGDALIEDLSPTQAVLQLAGLTPAAIGERYDANNAIKRFEEGVLRRRQRLLDGFAMSVRLEDDRLRERTLQSIRTFNQANPEIPIDAKSIRTSLQARLRYSERSLGGIAVNPKIEQRAREQGRFAEK